MAIWTYTTRQGDTWDAIALDAYGTEMLAGYLQQANPGYANLVYFPAGIVLNIPSTPTEAMAGPSAPWKRVAASSATPEPVGRLILDYAAFIRSAACACGTAIGQEASRRHTTAEIIHGATGQSLDALLDKLLSGMSGEDSVFGVNSDTGDVFIRDEPSEL